MSLKFTRSDGSRPLLPVWSCEINLSFTLGASWTMNASFDCRYFHLFLFLTAVM